MLILIILKGLENGIISYDKNLIIFLDVMCVDAKHAKKSFKYIISRKAELLELIYSDLADFKNTVRKY